MSTQLLKLIKGKLFGDSYTMGENVFVPSLNHIKDLTVENGNSKEEFVESRRADYYFAFTNYFRNTTLVT